jgi:hypothetical protein
VFSLKIQKGYQVIVVGNPIYGIKRTRTLMSLLPLPLASFFISLLFSQESYMKSWIMKARKIITKKKRRKIGSSGN